MGQQDNFSVYTAGIARQGTVGANNPVAGNNDTDGISADCTSDCLR